MNRQITRRDFIRWGFLSIGASAFSACGVSPSPESPTATPEAPTSAPVVPTATSPAASEPIVLKHELGEIILEKPVTRIATFQFQFLEALLALDFLPTAQSDEQQPGGLPQLPGHIDAAVKEKGWKWISLGNRVSPNLEVLATADVELIVGDLREHGGNEVYPTFNDIAPTMIEDTNSYAKLLPNFDLIAMALGLEDRAEVVKKEVRDAIAAARAMAGADLPRVLCTVNNPDKCFAYGSNSFQAGMLQDMGAVYVYREIPGGPAEEISLEAIPELDADVIIGLAFPGENNVFDIWETNPIWQSLPAVKNERVFLVDRYIWGLGRGVLAVETMVAETIPFLYPA